MTDVPLEAVELVAEVLAEVVESPSTAAAHFPECDLMRPVERGEVRAEVCTCGTLPA